ncbi:DUF6934 family protein [Runella slithyformis]|uniref:Uncharacterized protein n=1 Tax=Runella slithyformis (strain ATCC 29530 / DSM 19594 / LMG 11500 / NCIMB 11436 / LSU 4) TaxID=761193 RepID=A0A7U4E4U3_RUNSL|nr:hypothetical protein [Runella slithyformis]AEI47503.1 hypothetical protein Runsl_1072 [Runella slithyformis DSM 19594]
MDEPYYPYERPITEIRYDFRSISQEKEVRKRVIFTALDSPNIYNLALVDVLENGSMSDITETRNKDMRIVLATVIRIIDDFLHQYPAAIVLFRGSDERRQRLYRLIINRELSEIQKKFIVLGGFDDLQPESFQADQQYDYFLILNAV